MNVISTLTATTHTVLEGNEFVQKEESVEWTRIDLNSYYYDENTGNVITQEEFLSGIGYTEDDILKAFMDKYGNKYDICK